MNSNPEIFDREKILVMMLEAARSMIGQDVAIILRDPVNKNFSGHTFKKKGSLTIHIRPKLTLAYFYEVFLHEIGHIHYGDVAEFNDLDPDELPGGIIGEEFTEQQSEIYNQKPEEMKANAFIDEIDHYASQKSLDLFGLNSIEARLRVLGTVVLTPYEKER